MATSPECIIAVMIPLGDCIVIETLSIHFAGESVWEQISVGEVGCQSAVQVLLVIEMPATLFAPREFICGRNAFDEQGCLHVPTNRLH